MCRPKPILVATLLCALASIGTALSGEQPVAPSNTPESAPVSTEQADSSGEDAEQAEDQELLEERVRVIGGKEKVKDVPGSAYFIDKEQLEQQEYSDVHRVLKQVPGVYLQDEEGYGLRPNIGIRGTGVERSQKVTVMEDGILAAPAPYSAPSAYYTPTMGRMDAVEISKGPSAIRQGPYTNGGAINMISGEIPSDFGGNIELAVGTDTYGRGEVRVGDSYESFGWLFETYQLRTDGFKRLDGGGDTGFTLSDYMGKLRWNTKPGAHIYQSLELKLGRTEQDGDETYLGLTQEDFDVKPTRRYVASGADRLETEHGQLHLRYFVVPTSKLDLTTTLYYNDFSRNWHKLEKVDGQSVGNVLADPAQYSSELAVLRGETDSAPGALTLRNNRRDYFAAGLQSTLGIRLHASDVKQDIEVSLRLHRDEEDRFQEDDPYQILNGALVMNGLGVPGSQSNRVGEAQAVAVYVQDRIAVGRWKVTPGVRFESIDYERSDYGKADPDRTGVDLEVNRTSVNEVLPGLGVDYALGPSWNIFAGAHRGFSPPGPVGQDADVEPERSYNYELGTRYGRGATSLQAVAFFNDYDNLIAQDTLAAGGSGNGDLFNGGAARVMGLELAFNKDLLGNNSERATAVPFGVSYTYTRGEFTESFDSDFPDWGFVEAGDELTYLPRNQIFAEIGWRSPRWGVFLNGTYTDEMRTVAGQGAIPANESIENRYVFDVSTEYSFSKFRVFLQVRNFTDETYLVARRPAGVRPGLPRTAILGFGFLF